MSWSACPPRHALPVAVDQQGLRLVSCLAHRLTDVALALHARMRLLPVSSGHGLMHMAKSAKRRPLAPPRVCCIGQPSVLHPLHYPLHQHLLPLLCSSLHRRLARCRRNRAQNSTVAGTRPNHQPNQRDQEPTDVNMHVTHVNLLLQMSTCKSCYRCQHACYTCIHACYRCQHTKNGCNIHV